MAAMIVETDRQCIRNKPVTELRQDLSCEGVETMNEPLIAAKSARQPFCDGTYKKL